jgi:peptidoglycan/xylan/chitin deacetylase (PgdA/CDA1 family)
MDNNTFKRLPFIGWVILPLVGVFIATNYLIGITRRPTWAIINQDPPEFNDTQTAAIQSHTNVYKWNGEGLVTFWFDDAWLSQYTTAFPILKSYNYPASLAVPTNAVGWDEYMSWAQIRRLSFNGWEIASHSRSHECDLANLDAGKIENEIHGSQQDLADQGYDASIYVTPCGVDTPELISAIKNYYVALRTTNSGINPLPLKDTYSLMIHEVGPATNVNEVKEWIQEAKTQKSWLILMFHKIDMTNQDYTTTPEIFTQIVIEVKDSQLDVVTPSQVMNIVVN